jgi:hypothetical protein
MSGAVADNEPHSRAPEGERKQCDSCVKGGTTTEAFGVGLHVLEHNVHKAVGELEGFDTGAAGNFAAILGVAHDVNEAYEAAEEGDFGGLGFHLTLASFTTYGLYTRNPYIVVGVGAFSVSYNLGASIGWGIPEAIGGFYWYVHPSNPDNIYNTVRSDVEYMIDHQNDGLQSGYYGAVPYNFGFPVTN